VVFTFLGFVVAAEIDPDEPSLGAACDDLANFASHRDFLLACKKRHASRTHPIVKTGIRHLVEEKMANRPSVDQADLDRWPLDDDPSIV
jgi:hypothetical protein